MAFPVAQVGVCFSIGETNAGVLSQVTGGRSFAAMRRYSFAITSRVIASHHLAAETFRSVSRGPRIQRHDLWLFIM